MVQVTPIVLFPPILVWVAFTVPRLMLLVKLTLHCFATVASTVNGSVGPVVVPQVVGGRSNPVFSVTLAVAAE